MIGLSSYAFFWQQSDRVQKPMLLPEVFEATAEHGVSLFQICDYAPLNRMSLHELEDAAKVARDLGVKIELGTKGIEPSHLSRYLDLAEIFETRLVRSMVHSPSSKPNFTTAAGWLGNVLTRFESAGIELALETYEQVSTQNLVKLVDHVGSPMLGICLDPANVVARLENPKECVERCAPHVKNVHVKDFAFRRQDGWVGFTYSGAPMGEGLHDYPHLLATVQPRERGINEVVEHWLPWQETPERTVRAEQAWTKTTLEYLRRTP